MVFKNSIYLFKTPLDANYKNVYDDYSSEATYFSFLQKAFTGYKTITLSAVTSRKNVGDNFEIVVKGYDSMDLHDYNYMRFIDGNNTKLYAFILSVESINDNQDTENGLKLGSCLLKCKLDVWTNHYLEIKDSYNNITEQRCTLDMNVYKNYPCALKEATYPEEVTYDTVFPLHHVSLDEYKKTVVVWQVIATKDKGKIGNGGNTMVDVDSEAFISGYNLFYRPFAILTAGQYGLHYSDKGFEYKFNDTQGNEVSSFFAVSRDRDPYLYAEVKSTSAWFTTLVSGVPFDYDVIYSSTLQRYVITIYGRFQYGTTIKNSAASVLIAGSDDITGMYFLSLNKTEQYINWYQLQTTRQMVLNNNLRYTDECVESEQIYYEYPFNYYSLDTNKTSIPIVGQPFSADNEYLYANYTKKINPDISIYSLNDKTRNITVVSNEEFPIVEVALDEYLARNTGAMINQAVQGVFGMAQSLIGGGSMVAAGMATGNPMAVAAGGSQMMNGPFNLVSAGVSIATNYYDKTRTPAQIRQSNGNAMTSPIISDLITIKKHTCTIPNEFITDYHINGYECFYTGSIFEIRRDCFDIDCGNLDIACKISNEDKEELLKAFSRGVCRWHIANAYIQANTVRRNVIKNMNRKVYNYPISLFTQGGSR